MVGTADSVLIREVSLIQSILYREVPLYTKRWCPHPPTHPPQVSTPTPTHLHTSGVHTHPPTHLMCPHTHTHLPTSGVHTYTHTHTPQVSTHTHTHLRTHLRCPHTHTHLPTSGVMLLSRLCGRSVGSESLSHTSRRKAVNELLWAWMAGGMMGGGRGAVMRDIGETTSAEENGGGRGGDRSPQKWLANAAAADWPKTSTHLGCTDKDTHPQQSTHQRTSTTHVSCCVTSVTPSTSRQVPYHHTHLTWTMMDAA